MKKTFLIVCGLWLAWGFAPRASAVEPSLLIGTGQGSSWTVDFRLGETFLPIMAEPGYELAPFVNGGGTWWHRSGENVYGLVSALGLRLDFFPESPAIAPYVSASAGPSWISNDEFADRQLGNHFIFNTQGALGLRFGSRLQHDVALNATWYSNAGLFKEDDGYRSMSLSYNYWF
jgi:hypothetical protein